MFTNQELEKRELTCSNEQKKKNVSDEERNFIVSSILNEILNFKF